MSVYQERREDLEKHEFSMGLERGRLAVALDLLTDAMVLVGQHGVYCQSARQDDITIGKLNLSPSFWVDNYYGLTSGRAFEPRTTPRDRLRQVGRPMKASPYRRQVPQKPRRGRPARRRPTMFSRRTDMRCDNETLNQEA